MSAKTDIYFQDFYDALNDRLIEPTHPGISYSFTADGYYEEAYYRAIANPTNPACPGGIMQWQHGTFTLNANGSLSLTPFASDGRQLMSEPCNGKNGVYTRYNQSEYMKVSTHPTGQTDDLRGVRRSEQALTMWCAYLQAYEYLIDPYHNIPRLNLFKFDGSPMPPMYLVYSPPKMLPTSTIHPVNTATATAHSKRDLKEETLVLNFNGQKDMVYRINPERLWWVGLAFMGVGGIMYFGPRRLGIKI